MPITPLDSPHTPNFEKDKGKSPLGNTSTPPEPLFETDDDVLPDDGRPADGSDRDDSGKK